MITQYKDVIKDLDVIFDINLTTHSRQNKKANSMLGIIRRNFKWLKNDTFLMLARSHLEYAYSISNPCQMQVIKALEQIQMRATIIPSSLKNKP